MYRSLLRSQSWTSTTGYVCHHCRHRLLQAQTAIAQNRHASTESQTAAGGGGDEFDWFNSIGENAKKNKEPQRVTRLLANDGQTKTRNPGRRGREQRRQAKAVAAAAVAAKSPEGMEGLKAELAKRGVGKSEGEVAKHEGAEDEGTRQEGAKREGTKEEVAEEKGTMEEGTKQEAEKVATGLGRKRRHRSPAMRERDQRKFEAMKERKVKAQEDAVQARKLEEASLTVAASDLVVEASKTTTERSTFEGIMAGILKPKAVLSPSPTEATTGMGQLLAKLEAKKPADEVKVPEGITNTQPAEEVNGSETNADAKPDDVEAAHKKPQPRIESPDFPFPANFTIPSFMKGRFVRRVEGDRSVPETSDSVTKTVGPELFVDPKTTSRVYSFIASREAPNLAAKIREASSRPGWGGSARPSTDLSKSKLSFDSLREADKVSPKLPVRTAGERTAWGGEAVRSGTEAGFATSPGELAENVETDEVDDAWVQSVAEEVAPAPPVQGPTKATAFTEDASVNIKGEPVMPPEDDDAVLEEEDARSEATAARRKRTMFRKHGILSLSPVRTYVVPDDPSDRRTNPDAESGAHHGRTEAGKDESADAGLIRKLSIVTRHDHPGAYPRERASYDRLPARERAGVLARAERGEEASLDAEGSGGFGNDATERLAKLHERDIAQGPADDRHMSLAEAMAGSTPAIAAVDQEDTSSAAPEPFETQVESSDINTLSAGKLEITALNIRDQPAVPALQYGLDRVLFNSGVYQMQDPLSRTYNFDQYLQKIMPISEFDFNALKEYKTSSADVYLGQLANEHQKKYVGSTSSMTSTLGHFHYLLSNWRDLNLNMLSKGFNETWATFTQINRAPNAIFLRYKKESGTYAIDADKEHDTPNVLMMLGKSMEKVLTLPKEQFERYRRGNTTNPITDAEKNEPEAFEYTTMGDFLMRSQLDAYDPRLPGTGMFDLKTRAVLPIRMDASNYEEMLGYEILTLQGKFESYEREYYDMMRSTMLKYMLQARMGRMDGIFVAYHNIERIFGFQYLPIMDIDRAIHGQVDPCLGDQEFRISLRLLNEALELATQKFPEKSLRLHFEAAASPENMMWIFAEPMEEQEIEEIQGRSKKASAEYEANIMGIERKPVDGDESAASAAESSAVEGNATTPASAQAVDAAPEVDYISTTSSADPKFIKKLEDPVSLGDKNLKPLFAATLLLQNFVNGQPCANNRPINLKKTDDWEVQYILKEAPISLGGKWARYESMKGRRKQVMAKRVEEDDVNEEFRARTKDSGYFKMLKEMTSRGKDFRKAVDEMEGGRKKFVGDAAGGPQPVVSAKEGDVASDEQAETEKIDSVAGYMQWLYGKGT